MSPEQLVAFIGAIGTVLVGLFRVWIEVRRTHALVNSRMTELLELTRASARAQGTLDANTLKIAQERHSSQH